MKHLPYEHSPSSSLLGHLNRTFWQRWARVIVPRLTRALVLARHPLVRAVVVRILLLLGLVVQVIMLLVLAYMIDLCLSLMELWADLARKHLELTL